MALPGTEQLTALLRSLEGADGVLVLTHDNPDPDAIASAAALAALSSSMATS